MAARGVEEPRRPLGVRLEELARVFRVGPPAKERGAELDEPEIADEAALVGASVVGGGGVVLPAFAGSVGAGSVVPVTNVVPVLRADVLELPGVVPAVVPGPVAASISLARSRPPLLATATPAISTGTVIG